MRRAIVGVSVLAMAGAVAVLPAAGRAGPADVEFRVSGSVTGLFPGARRLMAVRVQNPYRRPLRLLSVAADVGQARRYCTASNLTLRPFRGRLSIPPRSARVVRLGVALEPTAAQDCSGGRFPLRFRAKGLLR